MVLKNFDQETTQLVPNKMLMKSKTELTQYYINQWQLTYLDDGKPRDGKLFGSFHFPLQDYRRVELMRCFKNLILDSYRGKVFENLS